MSAYDISAPRMRLKKLARRAAVGVGRVIKPVRGDGGQGVRVLTYHRFGHSALDPCCQTPQAFEANLAWLARHAQVLTPAQFDAYMRGELTVSDTAVLLTFDDGHISFAQHAMPVLARYGFRALVFVCPGLVNAGGDTPGWPALRAAAQAGHTIASHAYSHASLGKMSLANAAQEIDAAASALQENLNGAQSELFFAYPFGTRADRSPALGDLLRERGYAYCFTSAHGPCEPGDDGRFLPRIKIEGGNEEHLFGHIVGGCIDHWRLVDHSLAFLQQRGRL